MKNVYHLFNNLEFETSVRTLFNSLANYADSTSDVDRSLCEVLLQLLTESLAMNNKCPHDAFR